MIKVIEEIRAYVTKGNLELALEALVNLSGVVNDRVLKDSIRLTCFTFYSNKKEIIFGINDSNQERKKVAWSILNFLNELEEYNLNQQSKLVRVSRESKPSLNKSILFDSSILIVDDEVTLLKTYEYFFKSEGFKNIYLALNGVDALEKAEKLKPDLILLDIQMPYLDGFSVLKMLKEKSIETRVIIMSGVYKSMNNILSCIKDGACDFITKPVECNTLFYKIRRALLTDLTLNTSIYLNDPLVIPLIENIESVMSEQKNLLMEQIKEKEKIQIELEHVKVTVEKYKKKIKQLKNQSTKIENKI